MNDFAEPEAPRVRVCSGERVEVLKRHTRQVLEALKEVDQSGQGGVLCAEDGSIRVDKNLPHGKIYEEAGHIQGWMARNVGVPL